MLRSGEREAKAARWVEHLQAWSREGGSLSAYVRARGLPEWEAYRWSRILRREGRWSGAAEAPGATPKARFVRVEARARPLAHEPLSVTLSLGARRAELQGAVEAIAAVLIALIVEQALGRNAFDAAVYAFTNRARDRVKLLSWERNGYVKPSTKCPRQRIGARAAVLSVASLVRPQCSHAKINRPIRAALLRLPVA